MKVLRYTFDTEIRFSEAVVEHCFVLRCQPHKRPGVRVLEDDLVVEPDMRYMRQVDAFGNQLAIGRQAAAHDRISYHSHGLVELDLMRGLAPGSGAAGTSTQASPSSWTVAHPVYRYPSPLTAPSDALREFARKQRYRMGEDACTRCVANGIVALSHAVHEYMEYAPGTTNVRTTAAEAFDARKGVCQDYSHVLICLLRECGVPARYVSGLALGEGQTHAWVEAFAGGHWEGFDPTRDTLVDETYLPLAVGRDWTDCPIEQGSFLGLAAQTQTVHMTVTEEPA